MTKNTSEMLFFHPLSRINKILHTVYESEKNDQASFEEIFRENHNKFSDIFIEDCEITGYCSFDDIFNVNKIKLE